MVKRSPEEVGKADGRYDPAAFRFVYEGLGYTVKEFCEEPGHISGQMLADGLRRYALDRWGRLARVVLNQWGIHRTRDFGEIVYSLIEHEWMSAQPADRIEDFDDVYDFEEAFARGFHF